MNIMTTPRRREHNPFLMMVDPAAVLAAVERMELKEASKGRICRPLDRPMGGGEDGRDDDVSADRLDRGADTVDGIGDH
ncbi:MAG: hypothetical protein ACKVQR_10810 [Aquabacterium sp.]